MKATIATPLAIAESVNWIFRRGEPAPPIRVYMGCNIYPMSHNSWGGRWESRVPGYGLVMADTLAGVKELIKHYKEQS